MHWYSGLELVLAVFAMLMAPIVFMILDIGRMRIQFWFMRRSLAKRGIKYRTAKEIEADLAATDARIAEHQRRLEESKRASAEWWKNYHAEKAARDKEWRLRMEKHDEDIQRLREGIQSMLREYEGRSALPAKGETA